MTCGLQRSAQYPGAGRPAKQEKAGKLSALLLGQGSCLELLLLCLHSVQPLAGCVQVVKYFGVKGGELGVEIGG